MFYDNFSTSLIQYCYILKCNLKFFNLLVWCKLNKVNFPLHKICALLEFKFCSWWHKISFWNNSQFWVGILFFYIQNLPVHSLFLQYNWNEFLKFKYTVLSKQLWRRTQSQLEKTKKNKTYKYEIDLLSMCLLERKYCLSGLRLWQCTEWLL